jgi:hypothetical protein
MAAMSLSPYCGSISLYFDFFFRELAKMRLLYTKAKRRIGISKLKPVYIDCVYALTLPPDETSEIGRKHKGSLKINKVIE